jgi:hypothetical protein
MSIDELIVDTHADTAKQDIHETARQLVSHLGPTLVAVLSGVKDSKLPSKWSKADGPLPRVEAQKRLMQAHRAWLVVSTAESDYVARNWFIGANPRLQERSPSEALREGDLGEVIAAAEAFVQGTDG